MALVIIASLACAGWGTGGAVLNTAQDPVPAKIVVRAVPLYYFRDAVRLVKILNPDASLANGAVNPDAADSKRRVVLEKESDIQKLAATLATLKTQKAGLVEEQARTQTELSTAKVRLEAAKSRRDRLQKQLDDQDVAIAATDAAIAAIGADGDPAKKKALEDKRASQQKTRESIDKKLEDQKQVVADAEGETTELKEKLDKNTDTEKGLNQQIAGLEGGIKTAAEAVLDARKDLRLAEFDEDTEISKLARQNPLIVSQPANPRSDDPVRNVWVFAMADRAGLILRGFKEDVDAAEEVIASFDEPAPQARLTVFEMQVNVAQDNPSRERYASAQQNVLKKLSTLRYASSDATLAFVNAVSGVANQQAASQQWTAFYNPDVNKIFNNLPPDPRRFSSFGEAVIFYSLADAVKQRDIWLAFEAAFRKDAKSPELFPRFKKALDIPPTGRSTSYVSPGLSELIRGIQARRLTVTAQFLSQRWKGQNEKLASMIAQSLSIPEDLKAEFNGLSPTAILQGARTKPVLAQGLQHAVLIANQKLQADPDYRRFDAIEVQYLQDLKALTGIDWQNPRGNSPLEYATSTPSYVSQVPLATFNARVAAADAVLKQVVIAFEDDLYDGYLEKGFEELRKAVSAKGVNFGQLKKTSVLVTNRQFASVAGRAEAEVSPQKQIDLLDDVKRLLDLATAAGSSNPAGILGALGKEDKQAPNRPAEIYGLTSNGSFRVTPAFEPTGQALRFRFEYSLNNTIREPNGTVNPRIPQVDRQSINNEVQIGNFEIREISSFGVNSQLGLPSRKWGGIPILKDIPLVSEIPLIGWFHWRGGRSAVVQESIVFAQTAMYPTIGDLITLMGGTK